MNFSDPSYLDRIDELEYLNIVRLKGVIDQSIIPIIDKRIQANRKNGSRIDKNVVIDYAKVEHVDTATVAFHLVRLKEYEDKGFKIGFINALEELKVMLDMFKQSDAFRIFETEAEAIKEFNQ